MPPGSRSGASRLLESRRPRARLLEPPPHPRARRASRCARDAALGVVAGCSAMPDRRAARAASPRAPALRRRPLRRRVRRRRVVDQPLEVQLGDELSASRSPKSQSSTTCISVRRPSNSRRIPLISSGISAEPLGQLAIVDLEHGLERRQLLEQAPPLVDPAHALHQQALRRQLDHVLAPDVLELDLELALAPHQQAIDRVLAVSRPSSASMTLPSRK